MCLTSVSGIPKNKSGIGYKVLDRKRNGKFNFEWFPANKNLKIGQKIVNLCDWSIYDMSGYNRYNRGFHIFIYLRSAKKWPTYLAAVLAIIAIFLPFYFQIPVLLSTIVLLMIEE